MLAKSANRQGYTSALSAGTWQLIPSRSVLNGEPAIQSGAITINDREGNVWVSRTYTVDNENHSVTTSFDTDTRHNTSIKDKDRDFKSKAKWDGDVLKIVTDHAGVTTVERFSLLGDGTMMLQADRTGHPSETLYFQRQ